MLATVLKEFILEPIQGERCGLSQDCTDRRVGIEVTGTDLPGRVRCAVVLRHRLRGPLEELLDLVRGEPAAGCLLHERDRPDHVR